MIYGFFIKPIKKNLWEAYFSCIVLDFEGPYNTICDIIPKDNYNIDIIINTFSDCKLEWNSHLVSIDISKIKNDYDGDGLTDCIENRIGTDPFNKDSDGDTLNDRDDRIPLINDYKNTKVGYSTIISASLGIFYSTFYKGNRNEATDVISDYIDDSSIIFDSWGKDYIMGPLFFKKDDNDNISNSIRITNIYLFDFNGKILEEGYGSLNKANFAIVNIFSESISTQVLVSKSIYRWFGTSIKCSPCEFFQTCF